MITPEHATTISYAVLDAIIENYIASFTKAVNDKIVAAANKGEFSTTIDFPKEFVNKPKIHSRTMQKYFADFPFEYEIEYQYNWLSVNWGEGGE